MKWIILIILFAKESARCRPGFLTMIKNVTIKKVIISKHRLCTSFFGKAFGLMFTSVPDYGLIFVFSKEQRVALTMWFVSYPIDVLWLDSARRVVEIKKNFRPWKNYTPRKKAMYVIELPCGRIDAIKAGDRIEWC